MPEYNQVGENRLKFAPKNLIQSHGKGIIVEHTLHYSRTILESGIILPNQGDDHHEKKYEISEVISAGHEAIADRGIDVGDIVIYLCSRSYRLPNGRSDNSVRHLMADNSTVVGVMPNPDKPETWEKFNLSESDLEDLKWCHAKYAADPSAPAPGAPPMIVGGGQGNDPADDFAKD